MSVDSDVANLDELKTVPENVEITLQMLYEEDDAF